MTYQHERAVVEFVRTHNSDLAYLATLPEYNNSIEWLSALCMTGACAFHVALGRTGAAPAIEVC